MNIIRHIIDRDCHVGTPYRQVIRHVISKLKGGFKTFKGLSAEERRYIILMSCAVHYENRDLYLWVERGLK